MRSLWLAALAAGCLHGQELPRGSAEYGAFALPDPTGAHLIASADVPGAAQLRRAVCGGRLFSVQHLRRQAPAEKGNGRWVPAQFSRLAGDVFRVLESPADAEASCFLAGGGWLSRATFVRVQPSPAPGACGAAIEARVAAAKQRKVVRCFPLARLQDGSRLVLAEFARNGKHALAGVAWLTDERVWLADYAAEYRGEGEDLWRVDDGGQLSPEGFQIVFAARDGARRALGVSWAGTEGRSLAVFASKGNALERVLDDYWYQAPE